MILLKLQVAALFIIFCHFQECTAPGSHALETCEHHCSEHGHCVKVHASTYKCQCHHGWEGTDCSQEILPSGAYTLHQCHNLCSSHGTCVHHSSGHGYICKCDSGWQGSHCTQAISTSGSHYQAHCLGHCGSHGTCVQRGTGLFDNIYYCICDPGWYGSHCTLQYAAHTTLAITRSSSTKSTATTSTTTTTTSTVAPTTPMPTTTRSTTPIPTTTSAPLTETPSPILYRCDHSNTIVAIAYQTPVSNTNATMCPHGQHTSHEAFVLTECNLPQNPATWKQGVNVMSRCADTDPIPDLTPVASFDHGLYSSVGSLSGVFLGCTDDGFKMALQTCSHSPEIIELLRGQHFNQNPSNYYTIS